VAALGGSTVAAGGGGSNRSCRPHRGMTAYLGVGPSGRGGRRGGGGAPGRTAIQRKPAGRRCGGPAAPGLVASGRGVHCGDCSADGGSSDP